MNSRLLYYDVNVVHLSRSCYTVPMQTLLGMAPGPQDYDNHTALIGDDRGHIEGMSISPESIDDVDRVFAKPRYVPWLTVRLPVITYPTPDYGLSIHPPIDIDRMIADVMKGYKRVTASRAMPTTTFRELQLTGCATDDQRLCVYCVFDPVERVWYVYQPAP